jgi:type II secretory ATPase GspE/PulE/Tfp pilus assembly ATPase PilB-like protein
MNDESVNIMTLEDPVEYPLTLMRQTSVNEAVRMDFANGIRSMMRQDPDIILVGEIRDRDTAEMAFRAAMTGHQVFSTLHSNSALGAFPRLLDIGIQPDIMAGNIIGVVAQRLVRTLCLHCKEAYMPTPEERKILGTGGTDVEHLYRPVGCARCDNKGFKGRRSVMELLLMDVELDELVARRATAKELRAAAMANNFRPLAEEAIALVLNGTSSLAEISRTIDLTGRFS